MKCIPSNRQVAHDPQPLSLYLYLILCFAFCVLGSFFFVSLVFSSCDPHSGGLGIQEDQPGRYGDFQVHKLKVFCIVRCCIYLFISYLMCKTMLLFLLLFCFLNQIIIWVVGMLLADFYKYYIPISVSYRPCGSYKGYFSLAECFLGIHVCYQRRADCIPLKCFLLILL